MTWHPTRKLIVQSLALAVALCGATATALAAPDPARTDPLSYYALKEHTVAGVAPGGKIVLKTRSGSKLKGTLLKRAKTGLVVEDSERRPRSVSWDEIRWVRRPSKSFLDLVPAGMLGGQGL